jgi:pyrroloquinoline quinone biosynthesis protein B
VLLTNADLDHVLGLFCLREGEPVNIHAPAGVRSTVERYLGLADILGTFCGVAWHEPSRAGFEPLPSRTGAKASLMCRAIELPGKPPPFEKPTPEQPRGPHCVAYQFLDAKTGGRLLVAPDVSALNEQLLGALSSSDAVLFDGTFWSADELSRFKSSAPKAAEMGHVTIRDCSLDLLAELKLRHRIYIHINNTNPILCPNSAERAAIEAAGIVAGTDGLEFDL